MKRKSCIGHPSAVHQGLMQEVLVPATPKQAP